MIRAIALASVIAFQAAGGSISGRVTNSVTGAGIGGVEVSACILSSPLAGVCQRDRDTIQHAVTDDLGAFRIAGIPDGQYTVMPPIADGYFPTKFGPTPSIRVAGDTRFDLQLTPLASVRGRVLDPEDAPAAGIAVKLGVWQSVTDEKGEFVFEDVPSFDSFTLSATPKPQADAKDEARIVTTYYPSVVDSDQAMRIHVDGVDLFGYDIRLRTAPARAIRGVVIDVDGKPAPHARVTISKRGSGMVTMVRGPFNLLRLGQYVAAAEPVETKEDGTFAFPPVLEGDWRVRAVLDTWSENRSARSGTAEIRVSTRDAEGGDIDDLEIRLEQPFEIEVTADWGDSPPATNPPTFMMVMPLDGAEGGPPSDAKPGQPQRLKGFTGRYFIGPGGVTPGYYVAAAMLDNRDVLGQVVELSGLAALKMIYKTGGGSVRGTVEKGAYATVVLMADATPASRIGIGVQCDADGGFSIPDVPPGEYTAVAFQEFNLVASPEFPSLLAASGKSVKVEAGSAAQVDLRVARQQ
jgi:hypothetical protein